ncbi:MAG: TolB family protein [Xenococcaceae cyanobacterium]
MQQWFRWGIGLSLVSLLSACDLANHEQGLVTLNTRYHDEQPALSGNGRWLAFVSNRNGSSQIVLYDLQQRRFADLSGLNRKGAIAQSPSLSRTGRYIAYISSARGRPEIAIYDRATKSSEILTQGYGSWLRNPHISPDGRYIVFETARRGQWDIEVLDRGANIELDISNGSSVVNP